jgi:hypothetical protein
VASASNIELGHEVSEIATDSSSGFLTDRMTLQERKQDHLLAD